MGIPRLSSDLMPYAHTVKIQSSRDAGEPSVQGLVIDGPSMAYHVHGKVVAAQARAGSGAEQLLYSDINKCALQLMDDLEADGAKIIGIYFDGALPVAKRSVRLDRLEKTRQQLADYRKLLHTPPPIHSSRRDLVPRDVLWTFRTAPKNPSPLLTLPFLVASVIDALLESAWAERVHVTPGEADSFCAAAAAAAVATGVSSVAVVSNDSDLTLYKLGAHSRTIPLHSLQSAVDSGPWNTERPLISAQAIDPALVAQDMGVASLLEFGYQRYLDSSVGTAEIVRRVLASHDVIENDQKWTAFARTYDSLPTIPQAYNADFDTRPSLNKLDPRTAELVCALHEKEELRLYLPILFEDHDRDSSWLYGARMRQIAYTVLLRTHARGRDAVTEYARKGARVYHSTHAALSQTDLTTHVDQVNHLFNSFSSLAESTIPGMSRFWQYYLVAASIVAQGRVEKGKHYTMSLRRMLDATSKKDSDASWDDVHFHANVEAVLYSMRMLKQILTYCQHNPTTLREDQAVVQQLLHQLNLMPQIEHLFVGYQDLCRRLSQVPSTTARGWIKRVVDFVEPESGPDTSGAAVQGRTPEHLSGTGVSASTNTNKWHGVQHRTHLVVEPVRKRKRPGGTRTTTPNSAKSQNTSSRSTNPFALLKQVDG